MLSGGGQSWRTEILEPVWRFPLPAAFAVLALLINWNRPEARLDAGSGQLALNLWCFACFMWSWAAALWAEVQSDRLTGVLIGAGGAVLLALILRVDQAVPLLFASEPALASESTVTISHFLLIGALLFAPTLAPYLSRHSSQSAYWQYNHKWSIGYVTAAAGSVLAFAGVSAVVGSLALLLEVPIPRWIYGNLWLICTTLVMPWMWLMLSPSDFREEARTGPSQEFTSRAVGLLVIYILVPVAFALSAVLAAYAVKVIVEGSFTTARLGLTSVVYGASIVGVMLMAWPQRDGHMLVRLFWRAWPWLLIAPTLLLVPALWVRVAEFGWTPSRYFAGLIGIWTFGVMVVGMAMRGREDLRIITGLWVVLLFAAAFGPWGIADTSARSQFSRLEELLTAKGLLVDGRWRDNHGAIAWDRTAPPQHQTGPGAVVVAGDNDRKIASTALDVLDMTGQLDRLRPWFAGRAADPFAELKPGQKLVDAVGQKMALRAASPQQVAGARVFFSVVNPTVIALPAEGGGTVIGPLGVTSVPGIFAFDTVVGHIGMTVQDKRIAVDLNQRRIAEFDLAPTLETLKSAGTTPGLPSTRRHAIAVAAREGNVRLALTFVSGTVGDAQASLQVTAYLLLPAAQ
jgi:hypothetical protein